MDVCQPESSAPETERLTSDPMTKARAKSSSKPKISRETVKPKSYPCKGQIKVLFHPFFSDAVKTPAIASNKVGKMKLKGFLGMLSGSRDAPTDFLWLMAYSYAASVTGRKICKKNLH